MPQKYITSTHLDNGFALLLLHKSATGYIYQKRLHLIQRDATFSILWVTLIMAEHSN